MAHGILSRDFVYANTEEKDWHKLTQHKPDLSIKNFPDIFPVDVWINVPIVGSTEDNYSEKPFKTGHQVLITADDMRPCSEPFNPVTMTHILPDRAWAQFEEALSGTRYTIERIGMLWDRSVWFVSVHLDELESVSKPGEKFQLNFSAGLNGQLKLQAELSHTRVVCHNTLSASRSAASSKAFGKLFAIKQTKGAITRFEAKRDEIEKAVGMAQVFNKAMDFIANRPCSEQEARKAYAGEVATEINRVQGKAIADAFKTGETKKGNKRESRALNIVNEMTSLFSRGDGNTGSTRADALNGYTQFMTRGGASDSTKDPFKAIASGMLGNAADRKAGFFDTASDTAKWKDIIKVGEIALAGAKD